ncbi:MAG: urate hydroxylase PuuD [Pseudomonadota bacterium]
MEAAILEWLNMLLRLLHVVAAIAWIGASFYFIWLDLSLEPPGPDKAARGLGGELWSIHGGGIYEVGKYTLAPPAMPDKLHWFKWEAYSTWLTGSALLITYYYFRASTQLVSADGWVTDPNFAVLASLAYLLGGLALYEGTMRATGRASLSVQLVVMVILLALLSWLAFALFAARAAILHVGAVLATWMAANVLMVIIPGQKALVAAIEAGTPPDAVRAALAKRRSTHNNYLTLPVLFCMLSNHAPFVFGHPHAWLLVVALSLVAMVARHFFNAKHTGNLQPGYLIGAFAGFVAIAIVAGATAAPTVAPPPSAGLTDAAVQPIVTTHCAVCHAEQPTQPGFATAPGGYLFRTPADIQAQARLVSQSLSTRYMPLGNLTGMSDADRATLIAWAEQATADTP